MSKFHIYLVQTKGRSITPIDKDHRRVNKVIKVNNQYLKFGKSERKIEVRIKEYKRIFGENIKFESICSFENKKDLGDFKNHISEIFNNYRVLNPNSQKKLDWMTGISFQKAKSIMLKEYNSIFQNLGLNALIGSFSVNAFCEMYDLSISELTQLIKNRKKSHGRPKGKKNKYTEIIQEYLNRTSKFFLKKNPHLNDSQIADEILNILRNVSEEKISNEVLISIRKLSKERLRKLISISKGH